MTFDSDFEALTSHPPYHWQRTLYHDFVQGNFRANLTLPTGAGKTSLIPIWLLALAEAPTFVPRRIVWVVNRRVVVDQATIEAENVRERLPGMLQIESALKSLCAGTHHKTPLAISTLRGQLADNREWSEDASRPAIIIGTVDMIGSRLLFSGYGDSFKMRPRHAGLLGHDALIVNDEAHLTPAFARLLSTVQELIGRKPMQRPFQTIRLSATQENVSNLSLQTDIDTPGHFQKLWSASKRLELKPTDAKIEAEIAELAKAATSGRTIVFVRSPKTAQELAQKLTKDLKAVGRVLLLTGEIRGFERDKLAEKLEKLGFMSKIEQTGPPVWLVSTSAGEVGANFSCERLVTELDTADHLLQRFGRLNRFAETEGEAFAVYPTAKALDGKNKDRATRLSAALEYLKGLPEHPSGKGGFDISPGSIHDRPAPKESLEEVPLFAPLQECDIERWSQTTLHRAWQQRPRIEAWLHGKQDTYPDTEVVWRNEVGDLSLSAVSDSDIDTYLEYCPIRPHERLKMPTYRFAEILKKLEPTKAILISSSGEAKRIRLEEIDVEDPRVLHFATLLLAPRTGGIEDGHLVAKPEGNEPADFDVSHAVEGWRWRCGRDETHGFRTVAAVPLTDSETSEVGEEQILFIQVQQKEKAKTDNLEFLLDDHTKLVEQLAGTLAERLGMHQNLVEIFVSAARAHDSGKRAAIWQKFANGSEAKPLAKSIGKTSGKVLRGFRHEFRSLADLESDEVLELLRHLVASHHGFARPNFPEDTYLDDSIALNRERNLNSARRFAGLTRDLGPWVLAWLEAVFHTADAMGSVQHPEVNEGA